MKDIKTLDRKEILEIVEEIKKRMQEKLPSYRVDAFMELFPRETYMFINLTWIVIREKLEKEDV